MSKILVVDDELGIREALHYTFSKRGHQVATAMNTDHAASVMASQNFDLIILDILMPGEHGTALLKRLRAAGNKIPVIIYSVKVDAALEIEMRVAGANEVLHKRTSLETLVDRTEKVLEAIGAAYTDKLGLKKRLLVVDDEKSIRGMLRLFFEKKGYQIEEAQSGEEAVEKIKAEKPDIVLLDMNMGGMNGIETLKRIRELYPRLGVVMATADEDDQKVHQAMDLGAYGYVLKPFDFLYLELVVASKLAIAHNQG